MRHERFLLYPTFFHEKAIELQPRFRERLSEAHVERPVEGMVRLELVARVVAVWQVAALEPLRAIEAAHGLAWPAVESRFHYRNRPGVQVVATRVHRLRTPVELPEQRRYQGCVSWVVLDANCRLGHHVFADSANNGPVGAALVEDARGEALCSRSR